MAVPVADVEMPELDLDPVTWEEQRQLLLGLLEDHDWIARTPLGYVITRYDDATAMLRDDRWYSAIGLIADMQGYDDPDFRRRSGRNILAMEGDEHHRIRRLVGPAFTPKSAERLRPFMAEVIDELLDPICARGEAEFVSEVCEPYPIPIICEMLGAPREDWKLFGRSGDGHLPHLQRQPPPGRSGHRRCTERDGGLHDGAHRRAPGGAA